MTLYLNTPFMDTGFILRSIYLVSHHLKSSYILSGWGRLLYLAASRGLWTALINNYITTALLPSHSMRHIIIHNYRHGCSSNCPHQWSKSCSMTHKTHVCNSNDYFEAKSHLELLPLLNKVNVWIFKNYIQTWTPTLTKKSQNWQRST